MTDIIIVLIYQFENYLQIIPVIIRNISNECKFCFNHCIRTACVSYPRLVLISRTNLHCVVRERNAINTFNRHAMHTTVTFFFFQVALRVTQSKLV